MFIFFKEKKRIKVKVRLMSNKKIKIVFGINEFGYGGAEFMLKELLINLDKKKFDIYVLVKFSEQKTSIEDELKKSGINVIFFNCKKGVSLAFLYKCYFSLKTIGPSIIHTHLAIVLYFVPYILLHKCRCFHTVHSTPEKENKKIKLILKICKSKIRLIGISETIAGMIRDFYKVKYKIPIIYNPVNLAKFQEVSLDRNDNYVTFIIVARLVPVKNHQLLLDAFERTLKNFKNIRLKIVGDGPLKETLIQHTHNLGIFSKIDFLGQQDNIPYILKTADVFVLCSIYEGLPLSILEAMAAGLPIISTNVGGIKDIVKDNGILVESNNVKALSEAMLELAKNEEKRKKMSENSLTSVIKYDSRTMTQKHEDLYLENTISCTFKKALLKYPEEKKNLVSIIVPIYNTGKYLQDALDSILSQTYQNWEALLVNDGSTDDSAEVCKEYVTKDSRFRYIAKDKNEGLLLARKTGLENSNGEFIANLDSDDYYLPDFLEKMVAKIIGGNDFVWCNFDDDYSKPSYQLGENKFENCLNIADIYKGSVCNKLIRRNIYEKVIFPESHLVNGEDYIQTLSILYYSNQAEFVSDIYYFYRRDNLSTSRPSDSDINRYYARSTFGGIVFYLLATRLFGEKGAERFFAEVACFYFQLYFLLNKEAIKSHKLEYAKHFVPAFSRGLKQIKEKKYKRKIHKLTLRLACKGTPLFFRIYYNLQKKKKNMHK